MNAEEARELIESFAEEYGDAYRLAVPVSLAVRVEPELVRAVRLELLPDVDAGAEADLWFSPLVRSQTPLALDFIPEVQEELRVELSRDREMLGGAWTVISRLHRESPNALRLEEELTMLGLPGESDEALIEQRLRSVVEALRGGERVGLARWASRALPSLPQKARETEAARVLSLVAGVQTGQGPVLDEAPRMGIAEEVLRRYTARDLKKTIIGVRLFRKEEATAAGPRFELKDYESERASQAAQSAQQGESHVSPLSPASVADATPMLLEFSSPPARGSTPIELPDTYRLLLEVSWDGGSRQRRLTLFENETRRIEVGYGDVSVRSALGDTHTISPRFEYDLLILSTPADEELAARLFHRFMEQEGSTVRLKVNFHVLGGEDGEGERASLERYFGSSRVVGLILSPSSPFDAGLMESLARTRPEPVPRLDWLVPIIFESAEPPPLPLDSHVVRLDHDRLFEPGFRSLWTILTGETLPATEEQSMPETSQPSPPLDLFYSYSHADEELRDALEEHFAMLRRDGVIRGWHDRKIAPGREWDGEINEHLKSADIILLLVSPSFLASSYCFGVEVEIAVERHEAGEAVVVPVILRPCDWQTAPFAKLQALPKNASPVTRWADRDEAFLDVAKGIRRLAEELNERRKTQPPQKRRVEVTSSPLVVGLPRPPAVGFVSRRDEGGRNILELLKRELSPGSGRVFVLYGPGGSGKTTLAAEAARSLRSTYPESLCWVSALGRAEFSLSTLLDEIATQLGRHELRTLPPADKPEAVRHLVASAPALVVLDNFETIEEGQQRACLDFLSGCGDCPALVTTRERINRPDVQNVRVAAMEDDEAREYVRRLIEWTGVPQAFEGLGDGELARECEKNAEVIQWAVSQIALARRWRDVLAEIRRGEGDAAERVFTRSYNLRQLGDDGRVVLLSLSLFAKDASREALAAVAGFGGDVGRVDRAVSKLSSLSLVEATAGNERLYLRGLTRELARSRMSKEGRASELRGRYVEYFTAYAEANREKEREAFDNLEAERQNILAAFEAAYETSDWKSVMLICAALQEFLDVRGHWDEAVRTGEAALRAARAVEDESDVARFAHNLAMMQQNRGEVEEARRLYEESLEINRRLGDQSGIANTLHNLAALAQSAGEMEEARRLYDESLETAKRLGNQRGIASSLHQLGRLAQDAGEVEEARRLYTESLEIAKRLGDQSGIAITLHQLGVLAQEAGEVEEARRLYTESLEIKKRLGAQSGIAGTLHQLGMLAQDAGEVEEARRLYTESLEINRRIGNQSGIANTLGQLGRLAEAEGQRAEAARLYREALDIFERLRSPYADVARADLARVVGVESLRPNSM